LQSNTILTAVKTATQHLAAAGCDTPQLDAEILLAHTLKKERIWLYMYPEFQLDDRCAFEYSGLISRRQQREPVAYITGHKAFFALDFLVTPNVLIPRPETELLVENAIRLAQQKPAATIVDVGTGSGCISIALATHLKQANLFAVDISQAALNVAQRNAAYHQVAGKIKFLRGNLLDPISGRVNRVDIIVSNPPYVSRAEVLAETTMPEVRRYEPHLALNGGPAGLDIIEQLLEQAASKLSGSGSLLVEIGFEQGETVSKLAQKYFPKAQVQIKQDLAGLDRLLIVKEPGYNNLCI